ncbi:hypothetical protein ACKKBF_B13385 [Auxenochlorella protothecoides x Auxenochlorella symbiontica]
MAEAPCASGPTAQLAASPHDAVRWKITCMYRQLERVPSMLERLTSLGQGQLSAEVQEWVVGALMRDPYHASHVIDVDYHRRLCKALFAAAERSDDGVTDALADEFQKRQCAVQQSRSGWCQKVWTYGVTGPALGHLGTTASDGASGCIALGLSHDMLAGSTGCHEWEAGFWLAEYVLSNLAAFAGKHCVELGCGAGVVGVALARVGAASVLCTDGSPEAVANCDANLRLNGVGAGDNVRTALLRWEDDPAGGPTPDCILGADLLYDPRAVAPLLHAVTWLLQNTASHGGKGERRAPAAALIATVERNPDTLALFEREAERHAFLQARRVAVPRVQAVSWHEFEALEAARPRLLLHELALRAPGGQS